jgi:uncharacterized protein (DUF2267 family)
MDYETFTQKTADRAGLPRDTAERVEHATLATLADRITGGEARDLASQLPARLQEDLRPAHEEAVPFGVDEFVQRIAEQADVGRDEARRGAAAALSTVRDAVTPGEFDDVMSQLPRDFRELAGSSA